MIGHISAASMINQNIRHISQNFIITLWVHFMTCTLEEKSLAHGTRPMAHSILRLYGTFEPRGCTSTVAP